MRVEDFRAWLAAQGQVLSSISTRLSDARRVEAYYGDLDSLYEQDSLAGLLAELRYTSADRSAGRPNPTPLVIDGNLYTSLASYRSAIITYLRFLGGAHEENDLGSQADRIRRYVIETIIDPARRRGEATVDVITGEIHRGMKLENAMPAVCLALGGGRFERLAGVKITDRNGPANSSTVRFRYALGVSSTDQLTPASEIVVAAPAAKETFMPENLILYGPPGTGKTFSTAAEAVRLCDGALPKGGDDAAVRRRYRELVNAKQVYFVTFHQSFSYEDFVEGLRPTTREDDVAIDAEATGVSPTAGGFRLELVPGVFRKIATLAEQARKSAAEGRRGNDFDLAGRRFWKMGLGAVGSEEHVYRAAISGDYVALGWGQDVDWSDSRFASAEEMRKEWKQRYPDDKTPSQTSQPRVLRNEVKNGDIVIVPYGNSAFRAVAEVQGDYYFELSEDRTYNQRRKVRWLLTLDEPLPLDTIVEGNFTMRTLYEILEHRVRKEALIRLISRPQDGHEPTPPDQFVLIIDEINRADISKRLTRNAPGMASRVISMIWALSVPACGLRQT